MNCRKASSLFLCSLLLVLGGISTGVFAVLPPDGALLWHTYQGGTDFPNNNHDVANDMALDDAGNIYIVGTSVSPWVTPLVPTNSHTPLHPAHSHVYNQDIVVAKFNPSGTLAWHTFLGASVHWWTTYGGFLDGLDEGLGIAVDSVAGAVYITGWSSYTWGTPINGFVGLRPDDDPVAPGAPWEPGYTDAFVAKLGTSDGALVWNTFIGGYGKDGGHDVALDGAGNVYVTGESYSSWGSPVRAHYGGNGGGDGFVAQFDDAGTMDWNTFLGGGNNDDAMGITLDPTGDIFVAGTTSTYGYGTDPKWPATTDDQVKDPAADYCPSETYICGNGEAFVARLCNSLSSCAPGEVGKLMWYGFYGSEYGEWGDGVALDGLGYLYLVGTSDAPWGGTATIDPHVEGWDVFAAKIDATTGTLAWNTFMGGLMSDGTDRASAITADLAGNVFVTGSDFGPDYTGSHKTELFAARLNTDGFQQWYERPFHLPDSTNHVTASNSANAILLQPDGNPIMAGWAQDQWGVFFDPTITPIDDHTDPGWSRDVLLTTLFAGTDTDGDGWIDELDICPFDEDPLQLDADGDGVGDACDNCTAVYNPDQADDDVDGIGNICELDTDGDGIIDDDDNCPIIGNPDQADTDGDGIGDACDAVTDLEGPISTNVLTIPNPVSIGSPVTVTAIVDDTTTGGSIIAGAICTFNGGEPIPMSAIDTLYDEVLEDITCSKTDGLPVGVYDACVSGTDFLGNVGNTECILLAVFDPSAGFVTGGGWFNSPAGAYTANTALVGKANFGFVAKYKKGAKVPDGNTEFQFKAGDLNFRSLEYDWLVVANARAQFKGVGIINGAGNFGFLLTVVDAALTPSTDVDLFRIKIWNKDSADTIVYDNNLGGAEIDDPVTAIVGGSIMIHTPKGKK